MVEGVSARNRDRYGSIHGETMRPEGEPGALRRCATRFAACKAPGWRSPKRIPRRNSISEACERGRAVCSGEALSGVGNPSGLASRMRRNCSQPAAQ